MNNTQINIRRIEKETYSDQDWKNYFKIREMYSEKFGKPMFFKSWEQLKELTNLWIEDGGGFYTVHENNKPIGFFVFVIQLKEYKERQYVFYRDGLLVDFSEEIMGKIGECFLDYDSSSNYLLIQSSNGKNDFLVESINAEIGDNIELWSLNVKQAKIELINDWFKTYTEKFENYELRHYEDIPDDLLNEYCSVLTGLRYDMPTKSEASKREADPTELRKREEHNKKNNWYTYRYLVFDEGKLIGMTNLSLNKNKPEIMYQNMTGTLKKYRRKGIGKWMKSAMFLRLIKEFPSLESIDTRVDPENIGSIELSRKMGFENIGFKKDLIISREKIIEYLN